MALSHRDLAILWCKWNGQRGTDKQIAPVMKMLSVENLTRMLTERGVQLEPVRVELPPVQMTGRPIMTIIAEHLREPVDTPEEADMDPLHQWR
jgi:hypothetical protein